MLKCCFTENWASFKYVFSSSKPTSIFLFKWVLPFPLKIYLFEIFTRATPGSSLVYNILSISLQFWTGWVKSEADLLSIFSVPTRWGPEHSHWLNHEYISLSLVLWIVPLAFGWHYLNKWCSRLCGSHCSAYIFRGKRKVSSIWRQLGTLPAFGQRSVNSKYLVR